MKNGWVKFNPQVTPAEVSAIKTDIQKAQIIKRPLHVQHPVMRQACTLFQLY